MPTTSVTCPHCHKEFPLEAADYADIAKQVRDREFADEIAQRQQLMQQAHQHELRAAESETRQQMAQQLAQQQAQVQVLRQQLDEAQQATRLQVENAQAKAQAQSAEATAQLQAKVAQLELKLAETERTRDEMLRLKDEQLQRERDLKARLSTKMVGETLEQHCENEFNRVHAMAFPHASFGKDNEVKEGSKGDYIFRELDESGVEVLSIMFEMKNETDTTSTKKRNADFFDKLDKDRTRKGCEYAILVSLLEPDSELYNAGIVEVATYPKMYVVRPQLFLAIIGLLRNMALGSLEARRQLEQARNREVDVTRFEEKLEAFREGFGKNMDLASRKFQTAIDEIDKTIDHLEKVKAALTSSQDNLGYASDKLDKLTVKRLTYGNPTMKAKFDQVRADQDDAKAGGQQ